MPGRPAPWADREHLVQGVDADRVREVFGGRVGSASPVRERGGSPSAVLVALTVEPEPADGLSVLLTRRAWTMRTHRGEVSFPGGRSDDGEHPHDTARREAWEEVGLAPAAVEVVGEMDHLTTVTRRAYIVPVVALLGSRPELVAHVREVDAILEVPLAELVRPGTFREERWGVGPDARPVYFFDLVGDTVWGATAAMLRDLLVRLLRLDPGPETDYDAARGLSATWAGPWDPPPWIGDDVV